MAVVFGPTRWQRLLCNPLAFAELGGAAAGGYIICCNGGTAWVIAPGSTEVSRNWFNTKQRCSWRIYNLL